MEDKKKILILGGGFAGVYAYFRMKKLLPPEEARITLVSNKDHFLFLPLLHEVATGNLLPSSITQPIRSIAPECSFLEGEVLHIDTQRRSVRVRNLQAHKSGEEPPKEPETVLPYDYIIVALGAKPRFSFIPGAEEHGVPLYTLEDAKWIKNQIIESFEKAQFLRDEEAIKRTLTFSIIGGGPTGVELAGEISDLVTTQMKRVFNNLAGKARIVLINARNTVLEPVHPWFGKEALKILRQEGVEVKLGKMVSRIGKGVVEIEGGEKIFSENIFCTAGVRANGIEFLPDVPDVDELTGRIKVNEFLQVNSHENIFAAGDIAWIKDKETDQPYPMRAQFAVHEGEYAAENLVRLMRGDKLKEFHYTDRGFIVSLGMGQALAGVLGMKFTGPVAWFAYRTAYFFKTPGIKSKIRTAMEWTMNLFLPRDISKL